MHVSIDILQKKTSDGDYREKKLGEAALVSYEPEELHKQKTVYRKRVELGAVQL